jgi:hypothetical protein
LVFSRVRFARPRQRTHAASTHDKSLVVT